MGIKKSHTDLFQEKRFWDPTVLSDFFPENFRIGRQENKEKHLDNLSLRIILPIHCHL
jgi:hypothetical protein